MRLSSRVATRYAVFLDAVPTAKIFGSKMCLPAEISRSAYPVRLGADLDFPLHRVGLSLLRRTP